jgi:hypothetical protein
MRKDDDRQPCMEIFTPRLRVGYLTTWRGVRSTNCRIRKRGDHLCIRCNGRSCHTIKAPHGAMGLQPFTAREHQTWGTWTPTFIRNQSVIFCNSRVELSISLLLFKLLFTRVMLTFDTSPTRSLRNATVQPATRNLPFSKDGITAVVAETSSATSTLHTPFRSTNMLASILRGPRTERATRASETTMPGMLLGAVGATVSTPAKANNRRRRLWVCQTRVRSARTPRKSAV